MPLAPLAVAAPAAVVPLRVWELLRLAAERAAMREEAPAVPARACSNESKLAVFTPAVVAVPVAAAVPAAAVAPAAVVVLAVAAAARFSESGVGGLCSCFCVRASTDCTAPQYYASIKTGVVRDS
jgi:hypothetical protein